MKYIFLFSVAVLTFMVACIPVRFEQPQPMGVKDLSSFPEHLTGLYVEEGNDTLLMTPNGFEYGYGSPDSTCLKRILSPASAVLKKFKGDYVLSMHEDNQWDVFLIRPTDDGFNLFLIDVNNKDRAILERLEKITAVKEMKSPEGEIEYYLINPSKREFKKIIKAGLFAKNERFFRIK